jgi:acyl carrier protein
VFPSVPAHTTRVENRETIEAWDSLAFITLIILIEEEFGINVKVENMAELTSFSSFMRYLQRELGGASCDG